MPTIIPHSQCPWPWAQAPKWHEHGSQLPLVQYTLAPPRRPLCQLQGLAQVHPRCGTRRSTRLDWSCWGTQPPVPRTTRLSSRLADAARTDISQLRRLQTRAGRALRPSLPLFEGQGTAQHLTAHLPGSGRSKHGCGISLPRQELSPRVRAVTD